MPPKPSSKSDQDEALAPHILQRFEVIQKIGRGAYGVVYKCLDKETRCPVALKKIFGAFRNSTDAQRTYREITFLRQLQPHPHIVELLGVYRAANDRDLYVAFELLESDVHSVIRANILQDVHKRFIAYQLILATQYLHSRGCIHRDLKPSNLLINSDATIKLCDFGLARTLREGRVGNEVLTEYVSTRWYRSPELVIGSNHYNEAIDAWAIGVIIAELYCGRPLFPGTSTLDQLERICALTGPPTPSDVRAMRSEFAESMISNLTHALPRFSLEQRLPAACADVVDLVGKFLVFNPDERLTVGAALEHPAVAAFRNADKEAIGGPAVKVSLRDEKRYGVREYRAKIYKEMVSRIRVSESAGPSRLSRDVIVS